MHESRNCLNARDAKVSRSYVRECIFVSVCDCDCTQQSLNALWSRVRSPRERRAASVATSAATPTLATCCRYICGSRCCCCCCCHKRKTECMTNVRLARGCSSSSNEATAVAGVSSRYKIHGLPACLAGRGAIYTSVNWLASCRTAATGISNAATNFKLNAKRFRLLALLWVTRVFSASIL